MPKSRRRWLLGLLACAAVLAGCRQELGPERMPTTRVVGRVHVRATPVGGGWIEFHPIDGAVGVLRSARLHPDGTFAADGVALGRSAIQIVHPNVALPGGTLFTRVAAIRRDVDASPETRLDIDLQAEFDRLVRGLARESE